MREHRAVRDGGIDCSGNANVGHAVSSLWFCIAIKGASHVDKATQRDVRSNRNGAGSLVIQNKHGSEAMYIGIGGLVLLIILLIILL
jgi:ABC-type microcin C transport system permease subunit YejE